MKKLRSDASGMTLVEVIMTTLLFALVASVAGGLIFTTSLAQRTVDSIVVATTNGQLAADSIETGIRNASAFKVSSPSAGDQLVIARIPRGTNNVVWNCAAWYFDSRGDGSIRFFESEYLIAAPSQSQLDGWTVLVSGIDPTAGSVFTQSGRALEVEFHAFAGNNSPPATIKTTTTTRVDIVESAPCF
jgi:type II secretory pathway pseudopilin PulG